MNNKEINTELEVLWEGKPSGLLQRFLTTVHLNFTKKDWRSCSSLFLFFELFRMVQRRYQPTSHLSTPNI